MEDMKILVTELESDAAERASRARYELVGEILTPLFGQT
jgi:hypothetical protein